MAGLIERETVKKRILLRRTSIEYRIMKIPPQADRSKVFCLF
ncbi:hypothetical protein D1BOALGB6SA_2159 [Olavius sp. associated proteobacterium Delta 1]|nr:hypothetical protein D1BOALGB6SA_2159 [Olavius sp. associated proteobacterium Delta 1]